MIGLFSAVAAADSKVTPFSSVYFEAVRLDKVDTNTGLADPRVGVRFNDLNLETYAVFRTGADTRTTLGSTSDIYNDNYLFMGAGVDYLSLLPGTRLTAQFGHSFNLTDKMNASSGISNDAFDFRLGGQSYHEIDWVPAAKLSSEVYGEAFYVYRYRNFLPAVQFRTLQRTFSFGGEKSRFDLGPIVTGALAADSRGYDFNRTAELQMGARLKYSGPVSLWLSPYYVLGSRYDTDPSAQDHTYRDFRVLLAGYVAF